MRRRAGFLLPGKCLFHRGRRQTPVNKKADPLTDRLINNPEGLLLAASLVQHTQSAFVGFVSSLLSFLSCSQRFVSLAIGFIGTGLRTSGCVFSCGQTSFCFFGCAAATGSQNCGRARAENFRTLFIVFPLKDFYQISHLSKVRK
jgi:hypothetical protein